MKKLLFVSHHYHGSTMGAIRVRRLARVLPRYGWQVTVLTFGSRALAGDRQVDGARIVTVPAFDWGCWYARVRGLKFVSNVVSKGPSPCEVKNQSIGLSSLINKWVFFPDKQSTWIKPAVKEGRMLLASDRPDQIFTTIYPRSSAVVAMRLSCEAHIPITVEYRDLWTGSMYQNLEQPTLVHRLLHRSLERRVVKCATRISCVSRGLAGYLSSHYPQETKNKISLNYNFFDPEEYPPRKVVAGERPFTIVYAGAIYLDRRPDAFFAGLHQFVNCYQLTPQEVRFRWMGPIVAVPGLQEQIEKYQLVPFVEFLGQIPHVQALQELANADLSLLIQAPNDEIHIPGKLFEALGARVPLLALACVPEIKEIMEQTRAGWCGVHDPVWVASALSEAWRQWKSGQVWCYNETARSAFSMAAAGARLSAFLGKDLM